MHSKQAKLIRFSLVLTLFGALPTEPALARDCEIICKKEAPNPALSCHLKKKQGVLVVLRHAKKCRTGSCPDMESRRDCKHPEEGLTIDGRDQAKMIREGLADAGFSDFEIDSSKSCRTVQTAEIILDQDRLPRRDRLNDRQTKEVLEKAHMETEAEEGNRILVTHSNYIGHLNETCLAGRNLESDDDYGIALVYAPDGERGERRLQGCVWPEGWAELVGSD